MPCRRTSSMLIALVVLWGCTSGDVTPEDEAVNEPEPEELAWYAQRDPMPSCGAFELDEIALANVELEEANQCLLEAFESGEPAELQVALMTDEGDPIIETYRVIATGEVEMMVDTRQDDFGSKGFYYAVCTDLYENRPRGGPTVRVADCVFDEDRTVSSDR